MERRIYKIKGMDSLEQMQEIESSLSQIHFDERVQFFFKKEQFQLYAEDIEIIMPKIYQALDDISSNINIELFYDRACASIESGEFMPAEEESAQLDEHFSDCDVVPEKYEKKINDESVKWEENHELSELKSKDHHLFIVNDEYGHVFENDALYFAHCYKEKMQARNQNLFSLVDQITGFFKKIKNNLKK